MCAKLSVETTPQILAYASGQGFQISERQLKRWHSQDLIPRPIQQHHLGTPGSTSSYPSGTANQLCRLCEIQRTFHKVDDWGKQLWWLGFPVGVQYGRDALKRRAIEYGKVMPRFIAAVLGPTNEKPGSPSLTNNLKSVRTTDKIFGALRRRVGKMFPDFINFIAILLEGNFDRWSGRTMDDDIAREILTIDRAFGFWRAKNLADIIQRSSSHRDVEDVFEALSVRLGEIDLAEVLEACSDVDLEIARNQLCVILFASGGFVEDKSNGTLRIGLKVISIFHRYASFAARETMLYFLALKEEENFNKNVSRLMETFRGCVPKDLNYEQLVSFQLREPAIAEAVWGNKFKSEYQLCDSQSA